MTTQKPGYASQSEAYQALLQAGASPDVALVLAAVTRPESSGYTAATNSFDGHQFYGLWQIMDAHGFDPSRLRSDDIAYQAQAALQVYQRQGLSAWQTYSDGAYLKYLDQTPNALVLAHVNALTAANSVNLPAATKQAEGIPLDPFNRVALGQGPLAAQPTALDSPGSGVNPASAPATTPTAIDSPGAQTITGEANPLDSPGQDTASGNPIDGPIGFDQSVSPSGQ